MINWGVIGAGRIAHRFCDALAYDKRANLAAVSCRTLEKARAFQEKHPCNKIYDDYQKLLDDPEIDAVYISLPHLFHYEWTKKAIAAKKKVLLEKPAVIDVGQTEEIVQLARSNQVLLMEAMKTRFEPAYQEAKSMIVSGTIGAVEKVETSFCATVDYNPASYLFDLRQGGCLLDLGIYNIAFVQDFLGNDFEVKAVDHARHRCGVESYVKAILNFNNKIGVVKCALDRSDDINAVITGSLGKMVITPMHRPSDIEVILNDGTVIKKHCDYQYDDFYGEIAHFNDLILENKGESPIVPFDDTVNCAKILAAIREMM